MRSPTVRTSSLELSPLLASPPPSGHASVIDADDPDRVFDAAQQLGIGAVIDPFVPSGRWQTAGDLHRIVSGA